MDGNYIFDKSVAHTFILSGEISPSPEFISRNAFLVSLFLHPGTPFFNYIINSGVSRYELWERAISILKEPCENPTQLLHVQLNGVDALVDYSISDILTESAQIARRCYGEQLISVSRLIEAFGELDYIGYTKFLSTFMPNYEAELAAKHPQFDITPSSKKEEFIIPDNLKTYLTNLNEACWSNDKECSICGREAEIKQLTQILMKTKKRNAVLIGEPGVGKTAIAEKLTWMIVSKNCPEALKESVVVSLDITSIVAGTKFRGSAEERFKDLISFLEKNPQCILFVDEIHLLLGAGSCFEGELDLANALKPILARGNTRVIGTTTMHEYQKYFSKDGALKRRFEKIIVKEPSYKQVYPMIKNQINLLEESHKVQISKECINLAIFYASCFNFETRNPDRTLDLIDRSLANAEISGKSKVTKKDILDNFSIYRKKFKQMSAEAKMALAYHEAGHYVVRHFSPELTEFKTLAISILPAENYLGVNVFEIDPDITPSHSKNYFIQLIGSYLAGRISEEKYSSVITANASDDLKKATKIAQDVVTKYGLEKVAPNRVICSESEQLIQPDQIKLTIYENVDSILSEAYQYAKRVLAEHSAFLTMLANTLVKNEIMSEKEINKILKSFD